MSNDTGFLKMAGVTAPMKGQYRLVMFIAGLATVFMLFTQAYGWYSGLPQMFGPVGAAIMILVFAVLAWCWFSIAATGFLPRLVIAAISRITSRSRPTR